MNTTANMIDIALNKLTLWDGNVRKTGAETALDELAASIAAHGLINPLTVRAGTKGRYAVVAGQRRYLAMKQMAKAGTLSKTAPVPCLVAADEQDAAELSLAENVVRVAMHPADQFEAWRGLIDKGKTVAEIASRFGVGESTVRKRLALARVSPRIFDLYRAGTIDLEVLQAFTLSDDHALQESVWQALPDWQRDNARAIRQAITATDVPCHDRRVRFVGLDAYEAAGGPVRRDLFDARDGGSAQDVALLDALTQRKLDDIATTVRAEGWAWVEAVPSFDWEARADFRQLRPEDAPLSEALQEETDRLAAEYDDLSEAEDDEAAASRQREIEARLDAIEALACVWPDEVKAVAGAVVTLAQDGTAEIVRGLLRGDEDDAIDGGDEAADGEQPELPCPALPAMPASLIEDLTAQKTAALRIELARSTETALALVVHALAGSVFYRGGTGVLKASVRTRNLRPSIREHETCPALSALEAERERLGEILPEEADFLAWCLAADRDTLLDVLAVAAAHGLDAAQSKSDPNRSGIEQGEVMAGALRLDMAQWYRPTASGYFSRIGKAMILSDLADARQTPNAPAWEKLKKGELAELAEREIAKTAWLPALLR